MAPSASPRLHSRPHSRPRLLHVDLTAGTWRAVVPEPGLLLGPAAELPGGAALACALLLPHAARAWDDPESPLLLLAGPLTGTLAPCSGRAVLAARAPCGGFRVLDFGGRLPTVLRRAGWDGLVVNGRAARPTGIEISAAGARLTDASGLAGPGCAARTGAVFAALAGFGAAACVGPAAWRGAHGAAVLPGPDQPALGGGLGLTWAARNLAWVAASGAGHPPVADPAGLRAARRAILRLLAAGPALLGPLGLARRGAAALYDLAQARSMLATDHFRATRFAGAEAVSRAMAGLAASAARGGCLGCPVRCGRRDADGPLPGFESLAWLTAQIGNPDAGLAVAAHRRCLALGLDPTAAGAALAARRERDGRDWDAAGLMEFLADLARGGIDLDADGLPNLRVDGLDLPPLDPRGAAGLALGYALAPEGGLWGVGAVGPEVLGKPVAVDRFAWAGKARL
ncbi:MAG: aldehyde ferredoxin oxidoreductase N-terminal domain-containing protein, partial [Desulfovibrionaceae bacterium]